MRRKRNHIEEGIDDIKLGYFSLGAMVGGIIGVVIMGLVSGGYL